MPLELDSLELDGWGCVFSEREPYSAIHHQSEGESNGSSALRHNPKESNKETSRDNEEQIPCSPTKLSFFHLNLYLKSASLIFSILSNLYVIQINIMFVFETIFL